ncbi:ABC transporter permease [Arthrobacter castelli]|uniref:ABC transporter permease n=1 Tax=Arthrobacter castelli TaxID=271431 RepID=UPI00041E722D|nr:ABC transporter permease [Arthrobacter castelli]
MRNLLAISATELRRFIRDRSNIFFVFFMPLLLVVVLGLQFGGGGSESRVAVSGAGGRLRQALAAELDELSVAVGATGDEAMRDQVARGRAAAGVYIPNDAAAAFAAGDPTQVELIVGTQGGSQLITQQVTTALQAVSLESAQRAALTGQGIPPDEAERALAAAEQDVGPVHVTIESVSELDEEFSGLGQFDLGAASQLLLFVFLISLAGSVTLIQSRQYGVQRRIVAAPVSPRQALAGQALGRWVIAVFQGSYIMAATALIFDVDWGNLWLSLLVLMVFGAVAAGGAMLIGSLMDSDNAASGVGVGVGLVLAALGGCMLPLELFPDTLRTIANVTPHAWAYEAYAEIQRHGGGLTDILPQLAAMAAVLLALGAWALRRSVARAM